MANEKVNKVVLGNETLIDLTEDTVTPQTLLANATAHDASGNQIQGVVSIPEELNDHREEYLSGIQDVKDEVKSVKSTVELNQALTNEKIDTLSARVEKHNGVLERTFKLESEMAVAKEEIGVIRNNVDAIRRG